MCAPKTSCLLIALLLFQGAFALNDRHGNPQDNPTHVPPHEISAVGIFFSEANLDAEDDRLRKAVTSDSAKLCNHCCHCHGNNLVGLVTLSRSDLFRYTHVFPKTPSPAPLKSRAAAPYRPPIT